MFRMYADETGLPYSDYGLYRGVEIGVQRSVLSVAERGLWCWNAFELGTDDVLLSYDWNRWPENKEHQPETAEDARMLMERCAQWMLDEIYEEGSFSVWKYTYPITNETGPGYRSAHAQAVGMQLLTRMTRLSGDVKYENPLPKLLKAFEVPVLDGGLMEESLDKVAWFEKFADPENKKPKVLSGMVFAVLGLYDVAEHTGLAHAKALASIGTESILELLPRFDLGNWSAYDILGKKASRHYHDIHVEQLHQLFLITFDQSFLGWSDRFERYTDGLDGGNFKSSATWSSKRPVGNAFKGVVASTYLAERVHKPIWGLEQKAVRKFLHRVQDGAKVIDVPFGTGRFVNIYRQRGMKVVGADISQDMLDTARAVIGPHTKNVKIVRASADNLPFHDASFDVAVCVRFLGSIIPFHLVPVVLKELRRVTRSFAIVRLNNRDSSLPPLTQPAPNDRLSVTLNLTQLNHLCHECGWQITDSIIVGRKHPQKPMGDQRICLLQAIELHE